MKVILSFGFFIASIQLFSQNDQPKGAWILSSIRLDNSLATSEYTDGPYRWIYPNEHWLFRDQKIYIVDYPCCMLQVNHFVTEKETLRIKGVNGRLDEVFQMDFRNDSLILNNSLPYGSCYYFVKDTLQVKELLKFADGYVNPVCLYGDWEIPTGEVSVEFDAINVWYPWKLPEKVHVQAKNLHHYWANNRFYLEVDGVKRPFIVGSVSLKDNDLILIPDRWVKDEIKKKKLDPDQISTIWLRRITP